MVVTYKSTRLGTRSHTFEICLAKVQGFFQIEPQGYHKVEVTEVRKGEVCEVVAKNTKRTIVESNMERAEEMSGNQQSVKATGANEPKYGNSNA